MASDIHFCLKMKIFDFLFKLCYMNFFLQFNKNFVGFVNFQASAKAGKNLFRNFLRFQEFLSSWGSRSNRMRIHEYTLGSFKEFRAVGCHQGVTRRDMSGDTKGSSGFRWILTRPMNHNVSVRTYVCVVAICDLPGKEERKRRTRWENNSQLLLAVFALQLALSSNSKQSWQTKKTIYGIFFALFDSCKPKYSGQVQIQSLRRFYGNFLREFFFFLLLFSGFCFFTQFVVDPNIYTYFFLRIDFSFQLEAFHHKHFFLSD